MRSDGDANKDPRQLEREVEEQRREIGETMQALEDRFSSREIYDQASHYVKEHGRELAESFGNSIKANPLPVAVTAIGLLWMMVGQRPATRQPSQRRGQSYGGNQSYGSQSSSRGDKLKQTASQLRQRASSAGGEAAETGRHMREQAEQTRHAVGERMSEMRENVSQSMSGMREGMSESMSGMREGMSHSKERLGQAMRGSRSNMEHWLHDQPMAVGALGIALGAIVGAAMPRSKAENRMFGSIGQQARAKATELAEQGYQKASEMGESIGEQAQQAMESSQSESPPQGKHGQGKQGRGNQGQDQPSHLGQQASRQSSPVSKGPSASP